MGELRQAGLLVLHSNRLEMLAEAVSAWLASNPLGPLEQETVLVQSNGMAEWFKMELASAHGIFAATTVELPARFIWRAYRAVLGRAAVLRTAPLDKLPLTWRLMHLLPTVADQPGFESVRGFLAAGDAVRQLQLAQRLADLFDQYQVYRSDWLDDWGQGRNLLRKGIATGALAADAVLPDQLWQPALWRALQCVLTPAERTLSRADTHRRFLEALKRPPTSGAGTFPDLPRRIVLFGTTHIPHQTLEAISALGAHCQVLLAVPNPCRYHWADIIDGRHLLHFERRRLPLRQDRDLSTVPFEQMHAHGHPLLAAWGRQSRDFVRQLDAFDDVLVARQHFQLPRVDLFDDAPGTNLLEQVQAAVRDLVPLSEHGRQGAMPEDRSIVFHIAHSAQREVEVLHDQLLGLLASPPGDQALSPRDIVVMVPDIETFAPAIRSVFGQHPRWDPRHIPWGIADQKERGHQPLVVALEWLLRMPQERLGASQIRDLLDVPAVASRFGVQPEDLPTLAQWIEGAGIRWGLHAAHRDSLGLGAGGEQNSWAFGLRRMLLGYATGELPGAAGFDGVEPYPEVAGLSAGLAGALAELVQTLADWWADASAPRTPMGWAERLRSLLADTFKATDDAGRAMLAALSDALAVWLQACEGAGFDEPIPLAVVREAWLDAIDEPGVSRRFKAGGVTFCTLLPLRAIPFQVVCLLGMNDGDYPRRSSHSDFDLMALPGQARPGDRSRRDDDRQLMLDALLSARRVLYISWSGRSQRDNQEQPPSTLVAQFRDYLANGWGADVLAQRTTEHPLQPFSRQYFETSAAGEPRRLFTYAAEWRTAHDDRTNGRLQAAASAGRAVPGEGESLAERPLQTLTVQSLAAFLRNPVKEFFRHQLQVSFDELDVFDEDDESFDSGGLERWAMLEDVLRACRGWAGAPGSAPPAAQLPAFLEGQVARLQRAGRLPMAGPGRRVQAELVQALLPVVTHWQQVLAGQPTVRDKLPVRVMDPADDRLVLEDWLVGLRAGAAGEPPVWIELQASKVADAGTKKTGPVPRAERFLAAWVRCLASAACGTPVAGIVIGEGSMARVSPPPSAEAAVTLTALMQACRDGLDGKFPLPTAVKTGMAWLTKPESARAAYEGQFRSTVPGEGQEACLARLFPDFASLAAHPDFDGASRRLYEPYLRWLANHVTVTMLSSETAETGAGNE